MFRFLLLNCERIRSYNFNMNNLDSQKMCLEEIFKMRSFKKKVLEVLRKSEGNCLSSIRLISTLPINCVVLEPFSTKQ